MDDSCAVCAEPLEWVAYGACGHRDVCSTCVARLRFICSDRRCCICKSESSVVFVTKALGDYTRMINDFSVLPSEVKEGKVGPYWYHDDTQAFFDDADHYKMIKAMCRLTCSECDKMEEEQPNDGPKRRAKFKNIEQLKGHLFHQHKLVMCSLCLEGRKIFICEHKLYTRAQLKQHIHTGDTEVDGSESERGGFMGHPSCEFCRTPFYGENELYTHMNSVHYTCHICQRQHPGQYEYFKDYNDLEMHFRRDHFLCEDEACLAKKFVVFQSEAEIKRHNTIEHGGRMSRSKRNAALQIPTSFSFRSNNNSQDRRRGRARTGRPEPSDYQLSMAIEASLETSNADDPPPPSSSRAQRASDFRDTDDIDPIVQPFEELTTDSEAAARYLQALGPSSRNTPLQESSFPPLPGASSSSQHKHEPESSGPYSRNASLQGSSFPPLSTASSSSSQPKPKQEPEGSSATMAAKLHRKNKNKTLPNTAPAWQANNRGPALPVSNLIQARPTAKVAPVASSSSGGGSATTGCASYAQARPEAANGVNSVGALRGPANSTRISHSVSSPNLAGNGSREPSSDFPLVSAARSQKSPIVEDVQTANKSLVERIRSALGFDEEIYSTFKDVSGHYRQGLVDSETYLDYVRSFGLSDLVVDLARLCPDPAKQKELVDTYNSSLKMTALQEEDSRGPGSFHLKNGNGNGNGNGIGNGNAKGKGKQTKTEKQIHSKDALADSIMGTVRKLQSNYKPSQEEVEEEVLSKDGYRAAAKGKSIPVVANGHKTESGSSSEPFPKLKSQNVPPPTPTPTPTTSSISNAAGSDRSSGDGAGGSKHRKKTSKFLRVRLGDGSFGTLLDLKNTDSDPEPDPLDGNSNGNNPPGGLATRGVWRKGGGQKLFSSSGVGRS